MRRCTVVSFALSLAFAVPLPSAAQGKSDQEIATTIRAREAQRLDAYKRLDSAGVAALLAPDYLNPGLEGGCCFTDRAAGIRAVINHRDHVDPHPITAMRLDSIRIRVFGTTAVVTGIEAIDMVYPKHVPVDSVSVRFIAANTWVNIRGEWLLISQTRQRTR